MVALGIELTKTASKTGNCQIESELLQFSGLAESPAHPPALTEQQYLEAGISDCFAFPHWQQRVGVRDLPY
jgi:hypothetical protein